jgi:hypothetical protein
MKHIYLAGRLNKHEGAISEFSDELESRGHIVLEKWFLQGDLPKPYLDHPETSSAAARAMIHAAMTSDVFILTPADGLLGGAVELGAAIASTATNESKQVYVIDQPEVRQSVFYAHPEVIAIKGLDQIRQMDWY